MSLEIGRGPSVCGRWQDCERLSLSPNDILPRKVSSQIHGRHTAKPRLPARTFLDDKIDDFVADLVFFLLELLEFGLFTLTRPASSVPLRAVLDTLMNNLIASRSIRRKVGRTKGVKARLRFTSSHVTLTLVRHGFIVYGAGGWRVRSTLVSRVRRVQSHDLHCFRIDRRLERRQCLRARNTVRHKSRGNLKRLDRGRGFLADDPVNLERRLRPECIESA